MADYVSSLIANRMVMNGIDNEVVAHVCSIEESLHLPFSGLEINYLQEKYYKEHFPYVVSIQCHCNSNHNYVVRPLKRFHLVQLFILIDFQG